MPDYPEHLLGRGRLEEFVMTHFQRSRKATMRYINCKYTTPVYLLPFLTFSLTNNLSECTACGPPIKEAGDESMAQLCDLLRAHSGAFSIEGVRI